MSENNNAEQPTQNETTQKEPPQAKESDHDKNLRAVFEDLDNFGVKPIAVIQGGQEFDDLAPRANQEIRDRPFMIMEIEDKKREKQIYKRRIGDDPRESANNESFVLERILPEIMAQLLGNLKNIIRFPVLKGRHVSQRSFVEEYFKGKIMGDVHKASTDLFTVNDLHVIADVIKAFQVHGGKWIGDSGLRLKEPAERKAYGKYKPDLEKREKGLRATLGDETYERLMPLLEEKKEFLSRENDFLAAGDIQASNIIKMDNGQLGMIDWERINATNNPALDYCFMYAVLWDNPELQKEYLQYALSQNQEMPDFKEYFRLDFIFNRGTGELHHWLGQLQGAKTPDKKLECERAINRYKTLVTDAIDKKGVWADNQDQIKNAVGAEMTGVTR